MLTSGHTAMIVRYEMNGAAFRAAQAAVVGDFIDCYNCSKLYSPGELVELEVRGAADHGYASALKLHCSSCIPGNRAWNDSWVPGVRPLD